MTVVVFETNMGKFEARLYEEQAPITTENFKAYVKAGFYDGTIFHRVIKGFMVQGGGFDAGLQQKPTNPAIKNEADNGQKNIKYTLAMARTGEVDSATSQFFINTANNTFLDHGVRDFGYAVFGEVISGQDVIDKIESVQTTAKGYYQDVPVDNIVLEKVYIR